MQESYQIHPSTAQALALTVVYGLAVLAWVICAGSLLLMWFGAAFCVLLAWRDLRSLLESPVFSLVLDPRAEGIALIDGKQPYFYRKYKVYACRWFAILRLVSNTTSRTLILNSDRFDSRTEYRRLRYGLSRMETRIAD